MSTQRGNHARTRSQKHKNKRVFKNNLHDTSHVTKMINNIRVKDVCLRCKEIIDWKIKYKKYKPLSQPKKCVRCEQRTIKQAYHVICTECSKKYEICGKCCKPEEIVQGPPDEQEQSKLDVELKQLLQTLPERKRRTFVRYMSKHSNKEDIDGEKKSEIARDDLVKKLNQLMVDDENLSDFELSDDSD